MRTAYFIKCFFLIIILGSCKSGSDKKLQWEKTASGFAEFSIETRSKKTETGMIAFKPYGFMKGEEMEANTSFVELFGNSLSYVETSLQEELGKNKLGIGTQGYCRIDLAKWFAAKNASDYFITMYMPREYIESDSSSARIKLEALSMFDWVHYTSKAEAEQEFVKATGEDYKKELGADMDLKDFLPASFELKPKKEFIGQSALDSISLVLETNFGRVEIRKPTYFDELSGLAVAKSIVFKFVVF